MLIMTRMSNQRILRILRSSRRASEIINIHHGSFKLNICTHIFVFIRKTVGLSLGSLSLETRSSETMSL